MKRQPNFQKLFFDHFNGPPKKVTYEVRQDSNRYHDLVFLSSLIHDARLKLSDVVRQKKQVSISINRDCWELGIVKRNGIGELYMANGKLTFSPAKSIQWHFQRKSKLDEEELWIGGIWLNRPSRNDLRSLIIEGHGWDCEIILKDEDIRIVLEDIEVPYLYSQKEKSINKTLKRTRKRRRVA